MAEVATPPADNGDRLSLHQGLRTALAAALAYEAAELLHLPGSYWAAISAIVVMQSRVGATLTASRDRFVGTIMGAFAGWLTAVFWHRSILAFALAVLAVVVLCTALRFQNAGRLGGVTVAIIVLSPFMGPLWRFALERFLEVSFGIGVSLAVAVAWTKIAGRLRPAAV